MPVMAGLRQSHAPPRGRREATGFRLFLCGASQKMPTYRTKCGPTNQIETNADQQLFAIETNANQQLFAIETNANQQLFAIETNADQQLFAIKTNADQQLFAIKTNADKKNVSTLKQMMINKILSIETIADRHSWASLLLKVTSVKRYTLIVTPKVTSVNR